MKLNYAKIHAVKGDMAKSEMTEPLTAIHACCGAGGTRGNNEG